jgi:hypothetical protein
MPSLTILIPKPGTEAARVIDAGSGIVAQHADGDEVEVYYEGNRLGASNLRKFGDRVLSAAGRLVQSYPTIARGTFPVADFIPVGWLEYTRDTVEPATIHILMGDPGAALVKWLDAPTVPADPRPL